MWDPRTTPPSSLSDYLASMARAIFVSGMSWSVIDKKWDGITAAFEGFDAEKVAAYTPVDIERLMADPSVIHNRKKIDAIIGNAGELIVTEREFGSMEAYLDSFVDNDALIADLHKRFAFLGESVAHFFLFGISYHLPEQEKWAKARFGVTHAERHHH